MSLDIFDSQDNWIEDRSRPGTRPGRGWVLPTVIGALVLCLSALALILSRGSGSPPAAQPKHVIAEAVVGTKSVMLGDYPDGRMWLTFYRNNQNMLGEPIAGEHAFGKYIHCVTFSNYEICRSNDPVIQGTAWEYAGLLLGYQSLPPSINLHLDAPLAAPVRSFIDLVLAPRGEDWLLWLGRPISDVYCSVHASACFQAMERQILYWPNNPLVDGRDVRLSPLGLTFGQ